MRNTISKRINMFNVHAPKLLNLPRQLTEAEIIVDRDSTNRVNISLATRT